MEENVVHYYNVILGKIPCGARCAGPEKNFTVFRERVTCADCLQSVGKRARESQMDAGERSAA